MLKNENIVFIEKNLPVKSKSSANTKHFEGDGLMEFSPVETCPSLKIHPFK